MMNEKLFAEVTHAQRRKVQAINNRDLTDVAVAEGFLQGIMAVLESEGRIAEAKTLMRNARRLVETETFKPANQ